MQPAVKRDETNRADGPTDRRPAAEGGSDIAIDRPVTAARRLSLVPTPIGNLDDITLRALATLRAADVVAAEDTRRSRALLRHHGIDRALVRLDAHTVDARGPAVLRDHAHVAFVTDAGTPGISDPGSEIVRHAHRLGVAVEVLPGPTAAIPALVGSGLPTARFTFEGFVPRSGSARRARLEGVAASTATSIVYESPHRVEATVRDLAEACGVDRSACLVRELTKRFETWYRGTLGGLAAYLAETDVKGECVLVIGPADAAADDEPDFRAETVVLAEAGLRGRDLRDALQDLGAPRNLAYELALAADRGDLGGDADR